LRRQPTDKKVGWRLVVEKTLDAAAFGGVYVLRVISLPAT
jgi:hypothetical protein